LDHPSLPLSLPPSLLSLLFVHTCLGMDGRTEGRKEGRREGGKEEGVEIKG
jgi:hypothetical protein